MIFGNGFWQEGLQKTVARSKQESPTLLNRTPVIILRIQINNLSFRTLDTAKLLLKNPKERL